MKEDLISNRYIDDNIPLISLNTTQRKFIDRLQYDSRIEYKDIDRCPLCNHPDSTLIVKKDRYGMPLNTAVCDRCGFIFTSRQMTPDSAEFFYREYYRKIYEGSDCPRTEFLADRYKNCKFRIPRFLKKSFCVIEIGAGGGWNLIKFKDLGFKYYGFDYDGEYVKFGRDNYGLNLILGGLDEAKRLGIKADYLIISHVLEHAINPIEFLKESRNILNEKGSIYIGVPSASLLIFGGGATGYDLLGTLQNAHNFLFDEFTLKYLALKAGYRIKALLGGKMILTFNGKSPLSLENMEYGLDRSYRGGRVVKYLKLCESLVPIKNKLLRSPKIILNLHYLYYILNPLGLCRFYLLH